MPAKKKDEYRPARLYRVEAGIIGWGHGEGDWHRGQNLDETHLARLDPARVRELEESGAISRVAEYPDEPKPRAGRRAAATADADADGVPDADADAGDRADAERDADDRNT